ncbi:MAG TPA: hypothetical protein VKR30_10455 [Candidatus Limnocylindrales bacterium]|nr:hypothetical protein [Candidatus Limnocylindrales bacterium]
MTPDEFKAAFRSRTLAYAPGFPDASEPVAVRVGDAAHNRAGHTLLVVLANLLARAHSDVVFVGSPPRELLCPDVFGERDLEAATTGRMQAINPFGQFRWQRSEPERALLMLGVGSSARVEVPLGFCGWIASVGADAIAVDRQGAPYGAVLAAILGANVAFHRALGRREVPSGVSSAWDHFKPTMLQGPDVVEPLDAGRVLQVGAGGVGAALDYFVALTSGIRPAWTIVDGDDVDVK